MKEEKRQPGKFFENLMLVLKISFITGTIVLILRGFLFIPVQIEGYSMQSTLHPNDRIVMERFSSIHRFDIVVLRLEDNETLVKRVIGLPNDEIAFQNGRLYVNGKEMKETFLSENLADYHSEVPYTNDFTLNDVIGKKRLGEEEYFVMGDNRLHSRDSRIFGVVTSEQILGSALLIYSPLRDFRWLGN